ncbi:UpxY family transcription antiterminator [Microbacter margulisiae]|uniref:Transcription antitermination factor NusG n=1 Tax=Microbacter margulisiae TaxID=1350067 RepID=A0A7W5H2B6_9PORP|nr:UpxY family transcription antiterminator [Microbacter margulisiae]MBB3187236.1 transcription antitermination factor NusG [Microbacter margulisiae]
MQLQKTPMATKIDEPRWYAVYTAPRAEKKVSERFTEADIEHYLALQTVKRRWSDRIKEVIVPVIHGYIFVHIPTADFAKVTKIYGAIAFVRKDGKPVAIPDSQMERFRMMVEYADELVEFSMENFEPGETVKITKGPLAGVIGELVDIKGKHKVMIRLDQFGAALTTVPASFVSKIDE